MAAAGETARAGAHGAIGENRRPQLAELLLTSLEELAAAGRVETACRLAGHACAALRTSDPRAEHRFNALLHRLSRHLDW